MAIYYLSDLHLHHRSLAFRRGFPSAQEHDRTLLENLRNELLRGTVEGVGMRGGAVLLWVEEEKK